MIIYKAVRPKGYTGDIKNTPGKELLGQCKQEDVGKLLRNFYEQWAEQFFEKRPAGTLSPTFYDTKTVVRGTGDNGRWLVSWWAETEST